jgi:hypothetical protein
MATLPEGQVLSWDSYIEHGLEDAVRRVPELAARAMPELKKHIKAWRDREWKIIHRGLREDFGMELPYGVEPHWVGPGRAVYWQAQAERRAKAVKDEAGGRNKVAIDEVKTGWAPTSPLPANTAHTIGYYLRKGLQFRPPDYDVSVELSSGLASPAELPQGEKPPVVAYRCRRHVEGDKTFANWRAYMAHCRAYGEMPDPEQAPPPLVQRRMKISNYWCLMHHVGFKTRRQAQLHVNGHSSGMELVSQYADPITVDQMEIVATQLRSPGKR